MTPTEELTDNSLVRKRREQTRGRLQKEMSSERTEVRVYEEPICPAGDVLLVVLKWPAC